MNESADLFETRSPRPQGRLDDDLMSVLAGRIERLVERHHATQRAVAELREALAARDRRIVELDGKLAASEKARDALVERIDRLVGEVDVLLAGVEDEEAEDAGA